MAVGRNLHPFLVRAPGTSLSFSQVLSTNRPFERLDQQKTQRDPEALSTARMRSET
jgi:hypothetical protein